MKRPQRCGADLLNLVVMETTRSCGGYIYLKDMPVVWCGTLSVSAVDFLVGVSGTDKIPRQAPTDFQGK
jgi:hypothetical protein